ncbi:uncharacterized protein ColSpa_11243 [Colletotrichum spaethianum]|uniref:Uncharacterized protein n=1 Tax=Colletotrichum spaethianum TaxID=700344 RepID=A0AA37URM6_9PEZI|nr:uncharacterized protein ColSpa_11243 [Colletotrichum spaethianum]GKT51062.1 hypothetical protein ColSpa_11243 [Colletotrichum spaethianum]
MDNDPVPSPTPADLHAGIKLTCQHIFHCLLKLHRPLCALKTTSPHQDFMMDTKLSFTAWMLETAVEAGYGASPPSPGPTPKASWTPTASPPSVDVDVAAAVAVADWHFACEASFLNLSASLASRPAAAVNNYFKSRSKQQSDRRFAALRSSMLDVDDTSLYSNNQHPNGQGH